MNKYEEALNDIRYTAHHLNNHIYDCDEICDEYCDDLLTDCDILQELINQQKTPTLEEVKKEWEELGYEWSEDEKRITLKANILYTTKYVHIMINKITRHYWKKIEGDDVFLPISFKIHQLLTKTFKALGWEEEE